MKKNTDGLVISTGTGGKKQLVRESALTIKVQGQTVSVGRKRGVDLVFVIDTTGSMSDKIKGLLDSCERFVEEFAGLGLDHRMAVVAFGDLTVPEDKISIVEFTNSITTIKTALRRIPRYSGGGNEGESSLETIQHALSLPFRLSVVKALVLITDEPALQHRLSPEKIIGRMTEGEYLAFVVSPPEPYYRAMAAKTGGLWYLVSDSVDLESLLDMFRSLASKLSTVVSDVYKLADGSVKTYLQLKAPDR
jgi:von Willebrand factor type A domain